MTLTDDTPEPQVWTPDELVLNTRAIVRTLMRTNGLGETAFAEAAGMKPGTLRNRLGDKPSTSTGGQFTIAELQAIANAFGLTLADFEIPADDPIFQPAKGVRIGRFRTRPRWLTAVPSLTGQDSGSPNHTRVIVTARA